MIGNSLVFSISKIRLQIFKDLITIIILFVLSFYVVYFMPQSVSKLFFILLLFLFFISKKDYFWFAFFFILAQGPGYLFADFSALSQYRLPLYTFLPSVSFTPLDFFVILALGKALIKREKIKLKLSKPLLLILLYMGISLFITFFLFHTNIVTLVTTLRCPFYYSIILSFSLLIRKKKEAYLFIFLVTPFVFFIIFTQLYFLLTGGEFINLFNPGYRGITYLDLYATRELRPVMGGHLIIFFSFIFSIFLLENSENKLPNTYLYLIIAISCFSIFISATRIWFVLFSFILIGYILISKRKVSTIMKNVLVLFLLITILLNFGAISKDFLVRGAWGRMSKVFDIAKGDFHSDRSFEGRYFVRLPRLLKGVKEHIIIGCGFSDIFLQYQDNHVGFFNTILQFGILGFSLFLYFFISYFGMMKNAFHKINNRNPLKTSIKILALSFGGILIAYFTVYNFIVMAGSSIRNAFFLAVFISISELFVKEAYKLEIVDRKKGNLKE